MRTAIRIFSGLLLGLSTTMVLAQTPIKGIELIDPWIRASVPGQTNGAGYLEIKNTNPEAAAIVSATSERAARIELHTVSREGGMARMREVEKIDIPANGNVKLAPGGFHIMFIGLTQPFKDGETVNVELKMSNGQSVMLPFVVRPATHLPSSQPSHNMMKGHQH
jgi:periplasmic copper chaperone A